MESSCVRQNLIPGTSKLFEDYLYNFDRICEFYRFPFTELDSFAAAAREIQYPAERRERLIAALREQNGDTLSLRRLAKPGTVAVVTGQQVGLFSGPAYTIFKALTAVRLAEELTTHGIEAVPVFWIATEDHDLAEVNHAWLFDVDAKPSRIALDSTITNGGPVGLVRLGEIPLDAARSGLKGLPFADEAVERIARAYRPDATLGSAFGALLRDLLKDFDILYLDPLAASIREIGAPFLSEAQQRRRELIPLLRDRNKELESAGYHAQVHIEDSTSLLFLLKDGKRVPLRLKNGSFDGDPTTLSPNALLRPVLQDYLLPTVSYVGGPSEIAYMAQAEVLYRKLLGRMPVMFPRNGFTLLDSRASKLLDKYGLHVPDLLDHRENVKGRMAAKLVPPGLTAEFAELREKTARSLAGIETSLANFDPTLASATKKSSAKILYQIDKLSRKTARESLRRDMRATADADYLNNLIYPERHLQERFYSIIPFVAKHGLDLPRRIYEQTQLTCPDHMVRSLP